MSEPLLSVKNMKKTFQANGGMFSKKKFVHAVNDVSFDIYPGETFSLVGESGCGKSTTGKLIDHLITPDSGEIWFEGKEISKLSEKEMRPSGKWTRRLYSVLPVKIPFSLLSSSTRIS